MASTTGAEPSEPAESAASAEPSAATVLLTFGHGAADRDEVVGLLHGSGVGAVVDVRVAPGSRRHPHFARSELERWLPESGVSYRWDKRLGGRRRPAADSPDTAWRVDGFRGYAAHMRTADFLSAMDDLLAEAGTERTAVMCSESVWWRCHRRLIADFARLARGADVRHLMHDGRRIAHDPLPGARLRTDGLLVYDGDG